MKILNIISQIDVPIGSGEGQVNIPETPADGSTLNALVQLAFVIGAVAAMFVIIIAGIQFITSQGEPDKAGKARNAIIYAVIGLVICVASFTIVRFVLGRLG